MNNHHCSLLPKPISYWDSLRNYSRETGSATYPPHPTMQHSTTPQQLLLRWNCCQSLSISSDVDDLEQSQSRVKKKKNRPCHNTHLKGVRTQKSGGQLISGNMSHSAVIAILSSSAWDSNETCLDTETKDVLWKWFWVKCHKHWSRPAPVRRRT